MGKPLPYDSKAELRRRLADVAPHFGATDTVQLPMWLNGEYFKVRAAFTLSMQYMLPHRQHGMHRAFVALSSALQLQLSPERAKAGIWLHSQQVGAG